MNNTVFCNMIISQNVIKEKADADTDIDLDFIIKTMSAYTQNDLCLFRDCIDFMLIYNNR